MTNKHEFLYTVTSNPYVAIGTLIYVHIDIYIYIIHAYIHVATLI